MRVVIFEGTVEELKSYMPQMSTESQVSAILGGVNASGVSGLTKEEKPLRKPVSRKWHKVIAETDDGGVKVYKSAKAAYRWYASAAGMSREYPTYVTFYHRLKKSALKFADTSMTLVAG